MRLHKKIGSWIVDYAYMVRGAVAMTIHRNPPKHYLGHVVPERAPVILIPGILGKWGFMKRLGDKISLEGHAVYIVPKLGYNVYSIPSSAQRLRTIIHHIFPGPGHMVPNLAAGAEHLQAFTEKHNIKGAVIVAHSKGGLIGKYFLTHYNRDHRIVGMVAIATPFSGSRLAQLIPHASFRELKIDSKIIHDLESRTEANARIISVIPEFDNHVWSEQGSHLEGARENIEIPVQGHHRALFDKNVGMIVLKSIRKLEV